MTRTWAPDLKPTFQSMSDDQTKLFFVASMAEVTESKITPTQKERIDEQFLIKVIDSRIQHFKLPISFTHSGKLAVLALVDRPGSAMLLLLDCLNAYEGKEVNAGLLADLYPVGFYDEDTIGRYIDAYAKPKNPTKMKWAEIY